MPHIFIRVFDVSCHQLHLLFAKKNQSELQPAKKMQNAVNAPMGPN